MRSSRQVVDALLRAVDLAALFVFQSEAYTCHRKVSWVSAFRWWKTFTLTRKLTLCPVHPRIFYRKKNFYPFGMQYRVIWFVEMSGCKILSVSRVLKKLGIQRGK